ncbi:hypothetical protein [Actinomadura macrotermitis]|uniref:Uncharacterized protein n=1 Tax=Actinomadura macrotermitis TaxID=2585200 RepID=A0A7K0C3Y4_9ACTN|nr:hypothetical protein [Actinomadura macrotermitis]MQY08151.1 hypothetical protein [Actinomadura macrotermitis]
MDAMKHETTAPVSDEEFQRGRLAALGRAVEELTPLRAVVQQPADQGLILYVTRAYNSDIRETVSCRRHRDGWWFFYEWGDPICLADDTMRAARHVASIMGIRI